jgi:hypothetical protein
MSTFTSEPGTRLGGRYRLEDRVGGGSGWSAWKAIDETLARAVTVLTFAPGFPRITEVVTAARAASRLTDARLAQVFDVEEDWDHAYVVMEWVSGDSLDDMLADGPLDPGLAAEIIAQAAEALAAAHAAGVAHLCLNPGSLRWAQGGGLKIVGLGIDAALAGTAADDPALADTSGLGRLLYAALTAHWPGEEWPGLPPAPGVDGHPLSPRQVRAGVPAALDEIACRAMPGRDGASQALATPAALATELAKEVPAPAAPPPALTQHGFSQEPSPAGAGAGAGYWGTNGHPRRRRPRQRDTLPDGRAPAAPRSLIALVVLLVAAAIGLGAWTLRSHGGPSGGTPTHHPSAPGSAVSVLKPVSAHGFDALSPASADPGNENDYQAPRAIDGNPVTAWHTQYYFSNPRFGGLKTGTGLILDMGKAVRLSSVTVTFGPVPGANVRIELGNSNVRAPGTLPSFTTVARANGVSGPYTFSVHSTATGRYVLIWFTKLPPKAAQANRYEAEIFNIAVRGQS